MKNWMVYASGVFFFMVIGILFIFLIARDPKKPETKKAAPAAQQEQKKVSKLKSAQSESAVVRYTVHGQVTGNEKYRGIRMSVSPTSRTIELLQGYDDQVVKTQTTANTTDAYNAFIDAIDGAQFTASKAYPGDISEDSVCPLGQHYAYDIIASSKDSAQHSWSTSCTSKDGNFAGRADLIRTLFRKQIPDYEKFTAKFAL